MPTSTVEDYLKAILKLQGSGSDRAATGAVAGELGVTPGTATTMVKALADSGLVDYEPYAGTRLTAAGQQLATLVLRRHRLVEVFLVQVLGMDWSLVHDEADRLEHAISEAVLERIDQVLGHPTVDPHGDPIPSPQGEVREIDHPTLLTCRRDEELQVARVTDQTAEFLQLVERYGLRPGQRLVVRVRDETADTVELELAAGGRLALGFRAAAKILVERRP